MPRFFKRTLFLMALLAVAAGSLMGVFAASRGTVVVFDANWCASCREIVPIAREVASQNQLGFTEIDIDGQEAPKLARSFNLSVPSDDPPQVFFVSRGRATQIFNGKGYRFGQAENARAAILSNIQRALQ